MKTETTTGDVNSHREITLLKIVVFLCGAILMSLEMAGVRILNVYFGSTIYVWGAIISIFLGALSLGYYIGGVVADRQPRASVLGGIIMLAAAFILILPWISGPVCGWLGRMDGIDPRTQALAGSIILFFIPSVALGMVSPFAVKLAAHSMADIGRVAGRLYALSTLGSIAGTLLTSFVLVEYLGTKMIILLLGITLVVAAVLMLRGARYQAGAAAVGLLLILPGYMGTRTSDVADMGWNKILTEFDSAYHHIVITEGPSWYHGHNNYSRFLLFNRQAQSGIELEGEGRKEQVVTACGYTDMLHLGMLLRDDAPRNVLVIGCGGGVGPLVFRQDYPAIERLDVVDIDPYVFDMARKYFNFPAADEGSVIRSHVRDGRLFVQSVPDETYDYIVLDAYSAGGRIPFHLVTQEFFQEVRRVLRPDGVMVANVISSVDNTAPEGELYRSVSRTLETVFPNLYVFPRAVRGDRSANILMAVVLDEKRVHRRELQQRATRLEGRLTQRPDLGRFVVNMVERNPEFAAAPILTDNYAPTDGMVRY